jgi:hypothetical protein
MNAISVCDNPKCDSFSTAFFYRQRGFQHSLGKSARKVGASSASKLDAASFAWLRVVRSFLVSALALLTSIYHSLVTAHSADQEVHPAASLQMVSAW